MTMNLTSLPNHFFILLIRLYKAVISPWLPRSCRFTPSCSSYAMQAFQHYKVPKALYLSIRRILRCNPFHPGGYDPLP
ncbi:MAG TPA: membrane protein insertion efficiency factor YidD [Candidatus Cloacimonadota bacterium]|nr:membrane protein insertion efficiency factor YidD [Candidatus Cloacimonadota bacterium]